MQKKLTWLHISDIHFCSKTEWRDSTSRATLLDHLKHIFSSDESLRPDLIFCTGDIAYGELPQEMTLSKQYEQAKEFFNELLLVCGKNSVKLPIERLFIVPGNHDVNRSKINTDAQATLNSWASQPEAHLTKINQRFQDCSQEFKENIRRLDEYVNFVEEYLPHQHDSSGRVHYANISEINGFKVGIAGFNSAWTCAGPADDRKIWLAASWQFNSAKEKLRGADINIGLIHHSVDWLNSAERNIVTQRISSDFNFWLHGHNHNAWVTPIQSHIIIAAGAVSADTSNEFGINITSLDFCASRGITHLHNKNIDSSSWTHTPVANFAPNGQWVFALPSTIQSRLVRQSEATENTLSALSNIERNSIKERIGRYFAKRLNSALKSFCSQPNVWVNPILCRKSEIEPDANAELKINLSEFIAKPESTFIKAPPQYGLTCLSYFLVKEAWETQNSSLWLYLDSKSLKPHNASITQAINEELEQLGCVEQDIKCVILDSWSISMKDPFKLLRKVCERFEGLPIICMHQIDSGFFTQVDTEQFNKKFEILYLWALTKKEIREIVSNYNEEIQVVGDENAVTTRITADLEVLNLHRTPLNCLTLLKVFEVEFDESPVNRSEMIKRVLFLLFSIDEIPTYKVRPDLKDCENVLGYFCELLIRRGSYTFTRDFFLQEIQKYSNEQLIDLETHVVFDVLFANNILIKKGNLFGFRFSYWFYYFTAQRMYHDENFATFMLDEMRYAQYPELIEFYTGIDRRRKDALTILIKDIKEVSENVRKRCGIPENMNPYKFAQWKFSDEATKQMQDEIANGVRDSNLPDVIKDQYTDQGYDRSKPYDQEIGDVLSEQTFMSMMKIMRAGARALRNSDYVSPEIKRQLLKEILRCWEQSSKVMFIILPILADKGFAVYDGTGFVLTGNTGGTSEERFFSILCSTPQIIVSWCQDDLFSKKMGPLLFDQLRNKEIDDISRHELILLLIIQRPRDWKKYIQNYIAGCGKNSFYLLDVYRALRMQYRYSYASNATLRDIEYLIKMAATKHLTGHRNPGERTINKTKFKSEIIPHREV